MVKARASSAGDVADAIAAVRGFPRHHVEDFRFSKAGFFRKLDRLARELDDVSEFINLEAAGRYYVLRIRHR